MALSSQLFHFWFQSLSKGSCISAPRCYDIPRAQLLRIKLKVNSGTCNQRLLNNAPSLLIPKGQLQSSPLPFLSLPVSSLLFSFLLLLLFLLFSVPCSSSPSSSSPPFSLSLCPLSSYLLSPPPGSYLALLTCHQNSDTAVPASFMFFQQQSCHSAAFKSRPPGNFNDLAIVPSALRPLVLDNLMRKSRITHKHRCRAHSHYGEARTETSQIPECPGKGFHISQADFIVAPSISPALVACLLIALSFSTNLKSYICTWSYNKTFFRAWWTHHRY